VGVGVGGLRGGSNVTRDAVWPVVAYGRHVG
jgi:hypothetical protein